MESGILPCDNNIITWETVFLVPGDVYLQTAVDTTPRRVRKRHVSMVFSYLFLPLDRRLDMAFPRHKVNGRHDASFRRGHRYSTAIILDILLRPCQFGWNG